MSDLISRQAAIDALDSIGSLDTDADREYARGVFNTLPSAQPVVRCKDCEWWEKQKDSLQGRCALMQMYPTGQWYCGNAQRRVSSEETELRGKDG